MIRDLVLAVLLIFFLYSGIALGGIVYALISNLQRLRHVGPVFGFLLNGPAPLAFPVKMLGWAISASGLLIALGIFMLIFGPPAGKVEHWLILGASVASILRSLRRSGFFDEDWNVDVGEVARLFSFDSAFAEYVSRNRSRLLLKNYIDLSVATFLSLFVAYALVLYAIGPLGLMPMRQPALGLDEALWSSISLLLIFGDRAAPFGGAAWEIMNATASFLVWLYVILFASFGLSFVDEALTKQAEREAHTTALMKGIETIAAGVTEAADVAPALPSRQAKQAGGPGRRKPARSPTGRKPSAEG